MSENGVTRQHEEGLNAGPISPGLTVNDLSRSIEFYQGLGFQVQERHEVDGQLRFVALSAGSAHIGLAQDDFAKGRDRIKGVGLRFWITTDQDIIELAGRAKASGVQLDNEPAALPWGPMGFSVTDPDGFMLTIANGG